MDDDEDDDGTRLVPGDDIDGSGDGGPAVMAKGMVPDRFMRGYLTQGHAAQSPSVAALRPPILDGLAAFVVDALPGYGGSPG